MNRYYDGKYRPNYPKPEKEKKSLRDYIKKIDADVLGLQEIGSKGHLNELQLDLSASDQNYPYQAFSYESGRDRNLAFLSRLPLQQVKAHENLRLIDGYGKQEVLRGVLEIEIKYKALPIKIFNIHLKSRHTSDSRDPESNKYRLKEAKTVLDLIYKRTDSGKRPYILLGDLNDFPQSETLRLLTQNKKSPMTQIICIDSKGESWTHYYRKKNRYSTLDYILFSKNHPFLENASGQILRDRYYYKASDHRPIFVEMESMKASK